MKNHALIMTRALALSAAVLLPLSGYAQTRHEPDADAARSTLEKAMRSKNPETRKQAVQSMALLAGDEEFDSRLGSMLTDKDVNVRVAAVNSMMMSSSDRTAAALQQVLNDPAPEVSFAAAKALYTLNDPAGKDALMAVLNGDRKSSSSIAAERKREAMRMLHQPGRLTVFAATKSVWLAPVPGLGFGVSSLQSALTDKRESGRATTAMLLATDEDPNVSAALRKALGDKDAKVRSAAVEAIALRNDPAMQSDVAPLLEDKNEHVRLWAASCYLRMDWIKSLRASESAAGSE